MKKIYAIALLLMSMAAQAQNDTLTSHFVDYSDTLFHAGIPSQGGWGYVSGHNFWFDQAKLQKFDSNYGVDDTSFYIKSLLFWVEAKEISTANPYAFGAVWGTLPNGEPGNLLGNGFLYFDVDTTPSGLTHLGGNAWYNVVCELLTPIKVPANQSFWAGVQLLSTNYINHDYCWLKTTKPGSFTDTNYVRELWQGSTTYTPMSNWSYVDEFAFGVFPVLGPVSGSNPDTIDLSIGQITSPASGSSHLINTVTDIDFQIINSGNKDVSGTQALTISHGLQGAMTSFTTNSLWTNLQPGDTASVTLAGLLAVPGTVGSYDVCAAVGLTGDMDGSNDTMCVPITVFDNTSLNENGVGALTLYPNPVHDVIMLTGLNSDVKEISITDAAGRTVENRTWETNESGAIIDAAQLESGCYFLIIQTSDGFHRMSFIRE